MKMKIQGPFILGVNLDAFQSLTAQVEKAQNAHQNLEALQFADCGIPTR